MLFRPAAGRTLRLIKPVWMLPATSRTTNIWKLLEPKSMAAYSEVELIYLNTFRRLLWSAGKAGPSITERVPEEGRLADSE